jgi:hypothetical protein
MVTIKFKKKLAGSIPANYQNIKDMPETADPQDPF